MLTKILGATATAAVLLPTRASSRRNVRPKTVEVVRVAQAYGTHTRRRDRLPWRVRPLRHFPALALWPGDQPAHAASRDAEPKRVMSRPISTSISRAVLALPPGLLASWSSWGAMGPSHS